MWVVGPVSSVFDFITFAVLLFVFQANQTLFHTGWFIESMATQVLAIFVIRTIGNPFKSRPNRWLALTSVCVVLVACALPFSFLAPAMGFEAPPALFFAILVVMVTSYLLMLELAKRFFYRRIMR